MKIPNTVVLLTSGIAVPTAIAFLGEALVLMIPWFITMFFVVLADLATGLWKSYKLSIPIRFSKGCRDTMGKMLVYAAFVCMICCINVAVKNEFDFAKWAAMLIVVIESGSIIGNILKPHGINISLNAIIKAFVTHSISSITCSEMDEILQKESIDEIRKKELEKAGVARVQKDRHARKRGNNTGA